MPVVVVPSLDGFKLLLFVWRYGFAPANVFGFPLNCFVFEEGGKTWGERSNVAFRFFVEPELKRFQVARMLEVLLLPKQHGIGFGEPAFCLVDFLFECAVVDRTLINVEQGYVVECNLVEKDDELD